MLGEGTKRHLRFARLSTHLETDKLAKMFSSQLVNRIYGKLAPPGFQTILRENAQINDCAKLSRSDWLTLLGDNCSISRTEGPDADHGDKMWPRQGSPCRLIALLSACCSCLFVAAAIAVVGLSTYWENCLVFLLRGGVWSLSCLV